MSVSTNKILLGSFLLIFFILIGSVCAADNSSDVNSISPDLTICEEPIVEEVIENSDCVDENNFDGISTTYDTLGSSEDVDFTSDKEVGFDSVEIQFNGTSDKENIINWTWNFGDGEIGYGQNVVHTYSKIGSYDVNLTLKDINDNVYSIMKNNYINVFYGGSAFVNPDFEEGEVNVDNTVYGWIVDKSPIVNCIQMRSSSVSGSELKGKYVYIAKAIQVDLTTGNSYAGTDVGFGQYINFDCLNNITFYVYSRGSGDSIITYNIGDIEKNLTIPGKGSYQTVDTSNISGVNLFRIYLYSTNAQYVAFDNFVCSYGELVCAYFTYDAPTVENNQISVQFYNRCYGSNITDIFWEFDDGTTTTELNPTHNYTTTGKHTVKITASNSEYSNSYSYDVILDFPSINGNIYQTIQDAINNASSNAIINIPFDYIENLEITNKNLTLNFNGNKLTGNINVNDGAIVTVTNISDVSSVATDNSSKLTITDSNINSNLELKAGNIDVNGVNFNDSILTITSANATLVNVNVANGGIVVNGGKSKISNSNLTGSNVAISQTAGELEISNNIIKDNVKGIEITGGNATITFNAIYNNTNAFNATGATVTSTNNWYGTNTVTFADQYLRLVLKVDTAKMYSGDEYDIGVDLTTDNNEASTIDAGALNDLTLQFTTTNGEVTPVTIHNGKGELKFKAGSLTDEVKLTLFGEEYELEDASIVEKPLRTNITITSTEKGVITIVLKDSNGKNISNAIITYKINTENEVNKTTDANGIVSVPNLKGAISITVNYAGNDTYFPSNKENNFVFAYDTSISTTVAGNSIVITLKDDENKAIPNANVTYKINNAETTTATDINGTVTIPNLKGTIALTVTYKESELYSASNKTDNFVFPYTTTITAPSVSATYNVAKNLVITLKDENGKAVVGRTVSVKVGSISKNLVTNTNGQVSLNIAGLVPKTYTATISFEGDSLYTKSILNTVKVVVAKATPKITAKKATFKAKTKTKKYSITLKNNKGKAMSKVKVTLKVGKKTYKATTNSKGKATFKITKLTKKGKYTGTIKFAGNKYFKSASKKVKLTVKK